MDSINLEIKNFLDNNSNFFLKEDSEEKILCGIIELDHEFNNVRFSKQYTVELVITDNFWLLGPTIYEKKDFIKKNYAHINSDNSLCVATYVDLYDFFKVQNNSNRGFVLDAWIKNFVIPYFFSYEYYQKYKNFPFGDRSHGSLGIMEAFKEQFKVDNLNQVIDIATYIINMKKYRGHIKCPCKSGLRIRDCHKNSIIEYNNDNNKKLLLELTLDMFLKEITT